MDHIVNTNSIILIEQAKKLGIEVELLDAEKVQLKLTKNGISKTVHKKSFGLNASEAIAISRNKAAVAKILNQAGAASTPEEIVISNPNELEPINLPPFPLVAKPLEGQKGHHVFVGIRDKEELKTILDIIQEQYQQVIIQTQMLGHDTRFFVLDHKIIGIAQRKPPVLIGDGASTIQELILTHNQNLLADREETGIRMQNRLLNWDRLDWHIFNQGFSFEDVLPQGQRLIPFPIANFQAGGTVKTIETDQIHPEILAQILKITKEIGLTVCGVDMMIQDLSKPPQNNAVFIEINSDPSLRLHEWPNQGKPQTVSKYLLERIFA